MARPQRSKRRKSLAERTQQGPVKPEQSDEAKRKMCAEKTRYALRGQAELIAREHGLGVYNCPICGGWHLTSKPGPGPAG